MTPDQTQKMEQFLARSADAVVKRAYDQMASKGYEFKGADSVGSSYFNSASAQVPADASNLNAITISIPRTTYANAPVLWYGDLINQAITTTGTVTLTNTAQGTAASDAITAAQFAAAVPVVVATSTFAPPAWLSGPTGFFLCSPTNTDKSYQLSVAYMMQNAAIFDVLNIASSEPGDQAPVLRSLTINVTNIGPYGSQGGNNISSLNSTSPQNFTSNQLIIPVKAPMTLFHYLTFNTGVPAPAGTDIFFTLLFNVLVAQHRANDIKREAATKFPSLMSAQGNQLRLGPARP
jgi:hypothetical protein